MRTLSPTTLAKIAEKTGTEPIIILEVWWNDTTSIKYCDKVLPGIQGAILNLSDYNESIKLGATGNTGSLSVTLDDTDNFIKTLMDQFDINKSRCVIYQYFDGMDLSEAFVLYAGIIVSPIVWSEGQRTVSFNIITAYSSTEVGFSPEEGQFPGLQDDLVGKVWPLCFGSPVHVPATLVSNVKTGTLLSPYIIPDPTLKHKLELVKFRRDKVVAAYDLNMEIIQKLKDLIKPAYAIQEDYAHKIVAYDHTRQSVVDLSTLI